MKWAYGVSREEWDSMLESQQGKCAICGVDAETQERMVVDHCHWKDKVRGILCVKCNTGLGMFGDNVQHMETAIKYLKAND